ncbi:GntR family transcriptional regulator [Ensifer sp. NM-2]|uniref:GntR family transcriptional regulator n=1 Tax=Ensifer sp. NM-2 TaxID=2109730 RepID=UPI000D119BE5|nr:GntR family transcriptional regulator [Ensifer sp. NM-2]PSS60539.1 GntR family transcriptional regulator [Ensifer sp. NM-2]
MARAKKTEGVESESSLLSRKVVEAIRNEILSGRLEPGSRIRQEELAHQFEVSRIPVREALRQLESDGLVTLRANSGAWVAKLNVQEFIEIYKIRERLEPLALRESVPHLTDDQIARLDELRAAMAEDTNVEDFLQMDREFHLLTYSGARMTNLIDMIERFWNTTQHYRRMFTENASHERRWIIHAEHRLLVEALRRRDQDEAERILLGHIRRTRLDLVSRINPS